MQLEDLQANAAVRGILADALFTVVSVQWFGAEALLAVHSSLVEPLPHQITAVYESMLPRQPLRFLLADDPGASKTIMAGLLIEELIARGDLQRCLVVCPDSLAEQWQDELYRRFVKENLLKFDGRPLFPERIAHTVVYLLSPPEAQLCQAVSD